MKTASDWWKAVKEGDALQIREMLRDGIDVDVRDQESWTALMFAALNGHLEVATILIQAGANVNARSFGGFTGTTPLMVASSQGHLDLVRLLIDRGADVKPIGPLGGTAVAFAAFQGHLQIVRMLVDHGADILSGNIYDAFDHPSLSPKVNQSLAELVTTSF